MQQQEVERRHERADREEDGAGLAHPRPAAEQPAGEQEAAGVGGEDHDAPAAGARLVLARDEDQRRDHEQERSDVQQHVGLPTRRPVADRGRRGAPGRRWGRSQLPARGGGPGAHGLGVGGRGGCARWAWGPGQLRAAAVVVVAQSRGRAGVYELGRAPLGDGSEQGVDRVGAIGEAGGLPPRSAAGTAAGVGRTDRSAGRAGGRGPIPGSGDASPLSLSPPRQGNCTTPEPVGAGSSATRRCRGR